MFNNKRIKELEKEVLDLRGKILDLTREVEVWTNIYIRPDAGWLVGGNYYKEKTHKIRITDVLKDLLKTLGYKITYDYQPEKESYSLNKVNVKKKMKRG